MGWIYGGKQSSMNPEFIIKRNGKREIYDSRRVERAIMKAFESAGADLQQGEAESMAAAVGAGAARGRRNSGLAGTPNVEQVQDLVEEQLMSRGYFHVARRFILYREEHRKIRENRQAEILSRADVGSLNIVKKDGSSQALDMEKIQRTLERATWDIPDTLELDGVMELALREGFDGMSTDELEQTLIQSAASFIERNPDYDTLASRLFLQRHYKQVMGKSVHAATLAQAYRESFIQNIRRGLELEIFDSRLENFNLEKLAEAIDPDADEKLHYLGLQTLAERYFVKEEKRPLETPQAFWMRTAMGLAMEEEDREERAVEFYRLYSSLRFISSTPTLFHSGLKHPQLSSCYVSKVEDDLNHIFKLFSDNAQLSKWSGGIGNDWTAVRSTGAPITSTRVESQGVIPFLKIANDTTVAINRSGKRRGATVAYLECWHLDFEDFLDLRRNTGDERRRTHDMNTASWIPDLFMKRLEAEGSWTLFSPHDVPDLHEIYGRAFEERYLYYEKEAAAGKIRHKTVEARSLWRKMLTRLFETGHPWLTFKDPCNVRSPQDHAGVIHNSNLCTEITLNNSAEETAVCNLGSVNLARHTGTEGLNEELLADTIATAMRMLDNVININYYPTSESKAANFRHRPVGLGMMGLQDALFTLRIPFDSPEAEEFVDAATELFSYHAILNSSRLAAERGAYESYKGSKWDRGIFPLDTLDLMDKERGIPVEVNRKSRLDWSAVREHVAAHGMRNSNTMAIAPTATISNIAGCMPCIEPIYKNLYVKANMSGEFTVVNTHLVKDLKSRGLWSPEMLDQLKFHDGNINKIEGIPEEFRRLYKEAFEIDPLAMLRLTAIRGKWIDQSQSHNVFLKGATGRKMDQIYTSAWRMGLKTTYYLRTLAASQIEKSTLDAKTYGYTQKRSSDTAPAPSGAAQTEPARPETHSRPASAAQTDAGSPAEAKTAVSAPAQPQVKACSAASTSAAGENHPKKSPKPDNGIPSALAALIHSGVEESAEAVPASQVTSICSLLDPDCEACQ